MTSQIGTDEDSDFLDQISLSKCFCFISLRVCAIIFSTYMAIWSFTLVFMLLLIVAFPCKEKVKACLVEVEQRQRRQQPQGPGGGDPMQPSQHDPESSAASRGARISRVSLDNIKFCEPSVILFLTCHGFIGSMGLASLVAIFNNNAELLKVSSFVLTLGIVYILIPTLIISFQSKEACQIFCSLFWNILNIYGVWIMWSYYREIRTKSAS
uniref:Uncharacterized protein n=1 Tax=Cuerna arida TaxID=1464854 RepID=A0A1B6G3W1_9HEMI